MNLCRRAKPLHGSMKFLLRAVYLAHVTIYQFVVGIHHCLNQGSHLQFFLNLALSPNMF